MRPRRIPVSELIRTALMQSLQDYVKGYDNAKRQATFTVYRDTLIDMEKVMGKCVQRIAVIREAVNTPNKRNIKAAMDQCLEDVNATYEEARVKAEETPDFTERRQHEEMKAAAIERRRLLQDALKELT